MNKVLICVGLAVMLAGCASANKEVHIPDTGKWKLLQNPYGLSGSKVATLTAADGATLAVWSAANFKHGVIALSEKRIDTACPSMLTINGDDYSADLRTTSDSSGVTCEYSLSDSRAGYISTQMNEKRIMRINGHQFDVTGFQVVRSRFL
ncbi:hypothetical protein SAMN05880558_11338 [Aeromonas sp. RU39B]|uniref:hypothetical protein n=1 Tax=Aeromonas sp. RU39B TaxID=1907416 RepID=UPI00095573A7|nr:hypothetical protein [Aeromonas sp. RU39B]SIR40368.1 hypothetical protein SAMN05880558_11338 [Aeromonas sp. RU39B]